MPTPVPTPAPTPVKVDFNAGQSMTIVGDKLLIFDKSELDHPLKGGFVQNLSDLSHVGFFQHNISHAATADYAPKTDTMMLGNGGDGSNSAAPRIDLFPGFSRYTVPLFLDWYDPTTPRISIPLIRFAADGTTVVRSAFPDTTRRTANAVWIDDVRTILVFGQDANGVMTAVTMQLGRGTEDFSANGYGTFLPGKSEGEFNGTAKALATYSYPIKRTTQDAVWHDNKLYIGVTAVKIRTIEVLEFALGSGGALQLTNDYRYIATKPDGTQYTYETEGVTFRGNELLVTAVRDDGYHSIYRFDSTSSVTDLQP